VPDRTAATAPHAVTAATIATALLTVGVSSPLLAAQQTTRVSVDANGVEANNTSKNPRISADGRFVVFESVATNLVPNDTNHTTDVFVKELATGAIERVSVSTAGVQGDDYSIAPAISSDGRYVVFESRATNLIATDTNGFPDVFLRDRQAGTTIRVSVSSTGAQGNLGSHTPVISADGSIVVFATENGFVSKDTNSTTDVYRRDRVAKKTELVSVDSTGAIGNGASITPGVSSDGRFVVFSSTSTVWFPNDTNNDDDVFLRDYANSTTTCLSLDANGIPGTGRLPAISGDGSTAAFISGGANFVPNDLNRVADVFVVDLASGAIERDSVSTDGVEGNGRSDDAPSLTDDGSRLSFTSEADNLVLNDTQVGFDVFVHDRTLGWTTRVDLGTPNVEANGDGDVSAISADGSFVVFMSGASNLVPNDANQAIDLFQRTNAAAVWSSFGSGWPGTHGVPNLTPTAEPVVGLTLPIDVDNSLHHWTTGVMLLGLAPANLDLGVGGTVLVDPLVVDPISLPPGGLVYQLDVPNDDTLDGVAGYAQVVEFDPGASNGLSFTPGVELDFGF
jgi:Tol biopolymer transport system component